MSVNYSIIVIQIAAVSTGQVVLIYIDMDVSIYWHRSVLSVFVCMCVLMCVISNQSTSKVPHVSDLNAFDT